MAMVFLFTTINYNNNIIIESCEKRRYFMPSTYAHYRLGLEVKNNLGAAERKVVEEYLELFMIGLHGPDILFYFNPLFSNQVNQIGYAMHGRSGKEFFENAAKVIKQHPDNKAYLSYVYGFICHFILDETCHGYIDEKIESSGISHTEIEVEFDRMLMVKDGYDPIRHRLTEHIVPSMENAEVIQAFFEGADSVQVYQALKGMIKSNNLLLAPSKGKRLLINALLKVTGNYKEMHGLVVNYKKNSLCDDSSRKLWFLYQEAKGSAVSLIHEYLSYMEGSENLNQIYSYSFGSKFIEEEEIKDAI